jgi:hypothetical protein
MFVAQFEKTAKRKKKPSSGSKKKKAMDAVSALLDIKSVLSRVGIDV